MVRVSARHAGTDCHACGGCGLVPDRDVNAAGNILLREIAPAGRDVGPLGLPGAFEGVAVSRVAGLPGQDPERVRLIDGWPCT